MKRHYSKRSISKRSTHKNVPWKGWSKIKPNHRQRNIMYKKCGKKCFLGTKRANKNIPNFPVCKKNTCKVSSKGLWAAYIRAKQWGKSRKSYKTSCPTRKRSVYTMVARRAKRMLEKRGFHVNK
jgi:hypothetical protein